MAKDKLSEYDATAANNTVVGDVNLAENSCLPSDVNNAIREVMSHQKEAFGSATPLFVDQTNNRLGIGDSAPDTPVHITKTVNTAYSATNTTSNANNLLKLENPSSTAGVFAGVMFRTGSGADGGLNWVQGTGNDGSFTFTNQNSTDVEMMRIQSNGLVGIGTASPAVASGTGLQIHNAASGAQARLSITNNSTGSASSDGLQLVVENGGGALVEQRENQHLGFATNASERMRIDSSGNVLVGTTTNDIFDSTSETGSQISDGYLAVARASTVAYFNRLISDGEIVSFRKGASAIGSINSISGPQIALVQGSTGLAFYNGGNQIYPTDGSGNRDATIDLGYSSSKFKDGYFSGTLFAESFTGRADTDTSIQMAGSNRIKFFTASSERMRIDDDDILFGTSSTSLSDAGIKFANTSATHKYAVFTHTASGASESLLYINRQSSDGTAIFFRKANTNVGSISVDSSSTTYATSSDSRLKSNIQDAASASDKIDALQVRQFDWNVDGSHQDFGLVAQELQPIAPTAVLGDADSDDMMSVDYSKLVPMLIKEIQELRSRVATLEAN